MFISTPHLLEVFFTKLFLNLKSEVAKTYLSYIWWVLEPILMVAVYYVVFGIILNRGTPEFIVFLVLGKVSFLWFSKTVSNASGSILAGRGLINQVAIPKAFFPMLVVFQDAIKQLLVFCLMFAFLVFYGLQPQLVWFSVILIMLAQFLLICGVAMIVAAIVPLLPDFRYLITTLMLALLMGSGIFYSYKDVFLPEHQKLFLLNPIANLIKNYRQVVIDNQLPDWSALLYISAVSIIIIVLMFYYFRKTDTFYARLVDL